MNRREICSPTLYKTQGSNGSTHSGPTSTPRPKRAKPVDWEYQDQVGLFSWAAVAKHMWPELNYLTSTLNGVRLPPGAAAKAKRAGMKPGPWDIYLDVKRGKWSGLRIELKRKANKTVGVAKGRPSADQLLWGLHYAENGFATRICYGADEAIAAITQYLDGGIDDGIGNRWRAVRR